METFREDDRQKRKLKREFKFSQNKISKLKSEGNHLKGIDTPLPRSGHRIVVKDGNIYAFGGYTPLMEEYGGPVIEHVLFKELWKYNCASKTWTLLETTGKMPETLASHCVELVGNQMFVFGGTGIPFGETSSNSTHICDLETLEWSTLQTTGFPPSEQYGQAMLLHDNKMYVVGGTTGFMYSIEVHCLDLETREWKYLNSTRPGSAEWEPEARYRHEIAINDNKLFVFGGGTAFESFSFHEVPVFDLETHIWSKAPTSSVCPEARRCHGCVQLGSDVYMCGGFDGNTIFSDIWKFCLKTFRWEKLGASLPSSVYFHAVTVSEEGQLFVFGGVNSIMGNTRTNELYSMWLKIPTLSEMCWHALMKYIPHMSHLERKILHEHGVPFSFIKEVDFEDFPPYTITHCCYRIQS